MKRIVREIEKNAREIIRCEFDEYQGRQLFSVRVWFRDRDDNLKPTPKGISIDIRHLSSLCEAISEATAEGRRRGLLSPTAAQRQSEHAQ